MGWNFTVAKGGSIGSVIALWTVAMLYVMIVMMNTEMGSVMPEAGGQYTMAKYMLGPLAAFNVGLMLVLDMQCWKQLMFWSSDRYLNH